MKIRCGIYKNRVVKVPKFGRDVCRTIGFRPTKAIVRQAIFNILSHAPYIPEGFLQQASMIDLCCGSGVCGIEALSLGAQFVLFVDNNYDIVEMLKTNLVHVGIEKEKFAVLCCDVAKIEGKHEQYERKFNLVFLDLPYKNSDFVMPILKMLHKKKLLQKQCWIIVERRALNGGIVNTCVSNRDVDNEKPDVGDIAYSAYDKNVEREKINDEAVYYYDDDIYNARLCVIDKRLYSKTEIVILKYTED